MNIGIDLGTSNSVITVMDKGGKTVVIPNKEGKLTTPSIVYLNKNDEFEVGTVEAVNLYKLGSPRTVGNFKIDMGTERPFEIGDRELTAKELSAEVLKYLKQCAEEYLGEKVTEVVITIPAYFKDIQRIHTQEAAELAGLDVKRIINEPTSSALAYGIDIKQEQNVLVYDFGGGTFDVSLLTVGGGVVEVLATNGDEKLGGRDIDALLKRTIERSLSHRQKYTVTDPQIERLILELARSAKEQLTAKENVKIDVNMIANVDNNFDTSYGTLEMSQLDFNKIISKVLKRTVDILRQTVTDAGMTMDEVDNIILVGGSTKSPIIGEMLSDVTKRPIIKSEVDPDLIVGVGASIQASIISGDTKDVLLVDVTPFNLSIEVIGGLTSTVIRANSSLPTRKSRIYTTSRDGQTTIDFNIYQGNAAITQENEFLGKMTITGIPNDKAGTPQVEVTFQIDANGKLKATALDLLTMQTVAITRDLNIKSN